MFTCYLINGTIFPGRGGESRYIRCVFSFFASSVGNISNSKKNSGVYRPPCSVSLFFLYYNETLILTTDFMKKKLHVSKFMKIRPVGAELYHVDGQTLHSK